MSIIDSANSAASAITGTYAIDPTHSRVGFVARHAMVTKVHGSFHEFSGTGSFDAVHPELSHLELVVKVDSIDTGNADRDSHLRSNDFFDMATYPEIRFVSTAVAATGVAGRFRVEGDLTIKAITKAIAIDFDIAGSALDPFGNTRLGFEGSVVVDRKAWGVNWNTVLDGGGVLVSERVTLEFDVSAIRTSEAT